MATITSTTTPTVGEELLRRLQNRAGGVATSLADFAAQANQGNFGAATPTSGTNLLAASNNVVAPTAPAAPAAPVSTGTVTTTPMAQLQAAADAQRRYAQGVQSGAIPALTSQGGAAFPQLTDFSTTGQPVSGGAMTPEVRIGQQAGISPNNVTTQQIGGNTIYGFRDQTGVQNFTNVVPGTPGAQGLLSQGGVVFGGAASPSGGMLSGAGSSNGINFGATGQITPQQTPDALTASVNSLIGQALGMANTQPSGSDSFVDFFQKAATRKRGQEALASLANTAGQLAAKRASEADTNALQAQRFNQEYATELLKSQIGSQAAMAKAQMEAPKIQAETAKAQAEAKNLLLGQQAKAAFLQNPTPENAAILQSLITGQAVPPQKPTVTKVITPTGADNLVITSPTGRILAQGSPEVVQAQQNLQPGQAHLLANGQVLFLDPVTGQARQGTAAEYNAAYAKR